MAGDLSSGFLTISEVAQILRVSRRTVERLLAKGELPGCRVGRQWRFLQGQVLAEFAGRAQEVRAAATAGRRQDTTPCLRVAAAPSAERHRRMEDGRD